MRKRLCCLLMAGLLLLTASGCGSVFEAEYDYEEPVTGDFGSFPGDAKEIRNYNMLKTALTDMISRHEERGEFRLSNYNGSPSEDLAAACYEIKSTNPLGNYAVESMSYDTSFVVSYYMANIYISYQRTAEEIENVVYAQTQTAFDELVCAAADSFSPAAVIRVYSAAVDEDYIHELIRRHYFADPVSVVLEPEIRVSSYPGEGANRVYAIGFTYPRSAIQNSLMSRALNSALEAAVGSMTETEKPKQALESAAWLCAACADGGAADYPATAYGALVERSADSKGMALAYRAMCGRLEIPCTVVEGSVGAMGAEPHFWNIIELDGEHYHVDVSAFGADPAAAFLLNDDSLWGRYIWETEDYPACSGALRYADLAEEPEPAEQEESAEETESEAPGEEPEPTETPEEGSGEETEEKDEKTP